VVHGWDYADALEPLTETLFTSDEQLWRLEGHDALPEPLPMPESLALALGQPLDVELGSSTLVLVQLPSQEDADARLSFDC
jgi:hypothetical protein